MFSLIMDQILKSTHIEVPVNFPIEKEHVCLLLHEN